MRLGRAQMWSLRSLSILFCNSVWFHLSLHRLRSTTEILMKESLHSTSSSCGRVVPSPTWAPEEQDSRREPWFMPWTFYSWRSQLLKVYRFPGLHGSSGKLTGSTSSLNKLSVQSSGNRRSQSSSLLDMGNMSASDLDVADRARFDKVK